MEWVKVGEVMHYYGRVGVAAITLMDDLTVGDWVGFVKQGDLLFEQEVVSMQVGHQDVASALGGEDIGLKVAQKVKPGAEVYKLHQ